MGTGLPVTEFAFPGRMDFCLEPSIFSEDLSVILDDVVQFNLLLIAYALCLMVNLLVLPPPTFRRLPMHRPVTAMAGSLPALPIPHTTMALTTGIYEYL